MKRTIVQRYSSELVRHLEEITDSIQDMQHPSKKGQLREMFVENLVKRFIPTQFETGNGFIVNQCGDISKEFDVVIYDGTLIPPFLKEYNVGIYPAESVLATIEVKSHLTKKEITDSNEKARELRNEIYSRSRGFHPDIELRKPFCTVFGFYDKTNFDYSIKSDLRDWFNQNTKDLFAVCLLKKFSWALVYTQKSELNHFKIIAENIKYHVYEETKSYFALLLDVIVDQYTRTSWLIESNRPRNYFSIYLRDQPNLLKRICK